LAVHEQGTYACLADWRRETAAEVRLLQTLGADLVGMTPCVEPVLACELGLHYAAIAVPGHWAAGVSGEGDSAPAMAGIRSRLLPAILDALRAGDLSDCKCHAVMVS
jgi:purine nucleoside phosphorylase